MAQMKRKMTVRERLLEQKRKREEAESGQKFKQRLIKVSIITKPFAVLHGLSIFYCGYCGKPMSLFSTRPVQLGKRMPPLFYSCRDRCPRAGFHRAEFIDRLLLQLIQRRITQNFPEPKAEGDYEALLEKFKKIDELYSQRLTLLNKMHYASYKRDEILADIRKVKDEIEELESEVKSLFSKGPNKNPLMYPIFNTPPDEINSLDLTYRRELVKLTIIRVRFFNEFLIVRMKPLTAEDEAKSDEMGRIFNINLRVTDRGEKVELPQPEEIEKKEETQI